MKQNESKKIGRIVAIAGLVLIAAIFAYQADAHNGGMSKKDDCHNDRKAGERHWHIDGTKERGGICVDGVKIGDCEAEKQSYFVCRNDRWCSWQSEAETARQYIDCFEKTE